MTPQLIQITKILTLSSDNLILGTNIKKIQKKLRSHFYETKPCFDIFENLLV